MKIDILTIFPELFEPFLQDSLLKRAAKKKILNFKVHNLRDFASGKRRQVDDKPFGGERGMVMKIEPIFKAVKKIKNANQKSKIILFSPRGKKFNQKMATNWAKLEQLVLICGRYEGIDERAAKHMADEVVSIGDYVLMGGEVGVMAVIEAVCRLVPGVVGKFDELKSRISKNKGFVEYPQYTRPEKFEHKKGKFWVAPKILLSGDHKKIGEWRKKHSQTIE